MLKDKEEIVCYRMTATFRQLVLGSGGLAGLAYLGILRYMQERGLHIAIKHYYGVSIGAFFGFLYAAGISSEDIETELKRTYGSLEHTFCSYETFAHIHSTFGLDDGERLVSPLKNLYRTHYNQSFPKQSYDIEQLTFLEFAKHTGNTLTVVATNVHTQKPVFFSVDSTPHQCIWTAIQASMTIPGLFQPVKIGDDLYVDGFLTCQYPVPIHVHLHPETTLGIFITADLQPTRRPLPCFMSFTMTLLETMVFYNKEILRMLPNLTYRLVLTDLPVPMLPFQIAKEGFHIVVSHDDIDASIACGYERMYDYMASILPIKHEA
jgi:predicted acylesterase/phospholipase RssA